MNSTSPAPSASMATILIATATLRSKSKTWAQPKSKCRKQRRKSSRDSFLSCRGHEAAVLRLLKSLIVRRGNETLNLHNLEQSSNSKKMRTTREISESRYLVSYENWNKGWS